MRILFIQLFLAMLTVPGMAQKQKAKLVSLTPQQLMQQYRFEEAADMLDKDITTAKRRRKPIGDMELQQAYAKRMAVVLEGTQEVTFVDSVVVDKAAMLQSIQLSVESGTVTTYNRAFGKADTLGCTVYQSQLGNLTLFAQPADGKPMLYSSTLVGGVWSEPLPLHGLSSEDVCQNFPFMLSDGVTLYYGAINPEGLGGYDIYFSRFDNEERVFRTPENAGMPFNSPANDYMLCIDDFNNIGYLVTDRRQPAGKVCIYSFIPPKVRVNLADTGIDKEELRKLASLSSVKATQRDMQAARDAKARITALSMANKSAKMHDFTFIVDDAHIYHYASDFKNSEARKRIAQWQKQHADIENTILQLEAARTTYSTANVQKRTALRPQILTLEATYEQSLAAIHALEKTIRTLETKRK